MYNKTKKKSRVPLYTMNEDRNLNLKNYNPILEPIIEEKSSDSSDNNNKSPNSEWWKNSKHSIISLQSSNKSDDFFIPTQTNNIYKILKNLNKYVVEEDKMIKLKDNLIDDINDREKQKDLINDINKRITLLYNNIRLSEQIVIEYLNEIVIDTLSTANLEELSIQLRLKNTPPKYKKIYKTYKINLNKLLQTLDNILKHIKKYLTNPNIQQYKNKLIDKINIIKKKVTHTINELFRDYNSKLPFYKKKWWGGKTIKNKKWSNKYKRTINCKNPKGFSQKQYCKYGRK